ncbi:SH3 domain-containing protein [Pseudooctadecabacter sp.]|uniref:SH3 domain-containing protein n=1 Tax=Pseudooctadecabacter sp. TaxID=1966338 RepID=UPI0035C792A2
MIRLAAALILVASAPQAQLLPDRYSVTGVDANDVLNIRSGPGVSFDVIGELGPYTLNVEVIDTQDGWAMVPAGEVNGWVALQYLTPHPLPENEVPRPLICSGTEPFWDIGLYPRGAEYNDLALGDRQDLTVVRETTAPNGYLIEMQGSPTVTKTLTVKAGYCSDGMSDRSFNMSALLFSQTPDGNYVETGCCTFQPN